MAAAGLFRVDPAIFSLFPNLRIVTALIEGIDNATANECVNRFWRTSWESASNLGLPNAQTHPHVAAWRAAMRAAGVHHKDHPSSIEAILRRALRGGEAFSINPLVDLYNGVSLRHVVPAGAFDLDDLPGDLELRPSRSDDRFQALDAAAIEPVAPGEVSYVSGGEIVTRHFVWRQSKVGLVRDATQRAFFVSEMLDTIGDDVAEHVRQEIADAISNCFGVEASTTVVDASHPETPLR